MCVITNDCNQACKHCVAGSAIGSKEHLKYEALKQLLEDVSKIADDSIVSFVGGEATIWPGFFDIIEEEPFKTIKNKMLYTNATALSSSKIQKIKAANFYEVRISVDSDRKFEHDDLRGDGSFDSMKRALKEMVGVGIPVTAASVLKKNNSIRINEMLTFMKNSGIRYVHLLPFYYSGRGEYQREIALDATDIQDVVRHVMHDYPEIDYIPNCEKGTAYFKIDYNGDCILQQNRDKILLGNIYYNTFEELVKKALTDNTVTYIDCKKCRYYNTPILCKNMNKYCVYAVTLN